MNTNQGAAMSGYVDADGHVIEDVDAIVKFLDPPYDRTRNNWGVLPGGDRFHTRAAINRPARKTETWPAAIGLFCVRATRASK